MAVEEEPAASDQNLYVEDLAWPPSSWSPDPYAAPGAPLQTAAAEYNPLGSIIANTPTPGQPAPAPPPPPPPPAGDKKEKRVDPKRAQFDQTEGLPRDEVAAPLPGLGQPPGMPDVAASSLLGAPPADGTPGPMPLAAPAPDVATAGYAGPLTGQTVPVDPYGVALDSTPGTPGPAAPLPQDPAAAWATSMYGAPPATSAAAPAPSGPPGTSEDAAAAYYEQHPKELARFLNDQGQRQRDAYEASQKQAIADDQARASQNLAEVEGRRQRIQAQSDQNVALAQKIASEPINTSLPGGTFGKIAAVILSTIGGAASHWTGGHNWALEEIDKSVDDQVAAQKANIQNRLHAVNVKQDALAQAYAATGDWYRAHEVVRLAAYSAAQQRITTEMQNFDPRGSSVARLAQLYSSIDQQKQMVIAAGQDRGYKLDKEDADTELARANALKARAEAMKTLGEVGGGGGGGAGAGSATNPQYTVATGYFDPFDMKTPIMGRRQVGGKGEDPKERQLLQTQIDEYKHVQDQLKKMHDIVGELGDGGKGVSESLWKKRKTTLAADYDAAREALVSYMTKAIGDRPTQGQLELQAQRIPERASVFEARDPVKLIESQQDEADRALSADLGVIGVDPSSLIEHAKQMRAPAPEPAIADEVTAAQQALSTAQPGTSEYRDAQAALEYANERRAQKIERKTSDQNAVQQQASEARNQILPDTLDVAGLPPVVRARVESFNQATETHQRELDHLLELQGQKPKTIGQRGVDQKTAGDHADAIARQAGIARDAERAQRAAMNDALRSTLENLDQLDPDKRQAILELAEKTGVTAPIRDKAKDFALSIVNPGSVIEPHSTQRLVDAATGDNDVQGGLRFRYGLLKILGSTDFSDHKAEQ